MPYYYEAKRWRIVMICVEKVADVSFEEVAANGFFRRELVPTHIPLHAASIIGGVALH